MVQIVFDTAGFLAGLENSFEKVYTTVDVIKEVKDYNSHKMLDFAISSGKIIIMNPSLNGINKVKKILTEINENTLSKTDISIIALALDLSPSIVFTDDLSVQNILLKLNIKFTSVKINRSANQIYKFKYKCSNCNKMFSKYIVECPYCGSKIIKT